MRTATKGRSYQRTGSEVWGSQSTSSSPVNHSSPNLEDNSGAPSFPLRQSAFSLERGADSASSRRGLAMAPLPWWAVVLLQVGQGCILYLALCPQPPMPPPPAPPAPPDADALWKDGWAAAIDTFGLCTLAERGELHFDIYANAFVGCDGRAWSKLAFCCAPERPSAPLLSLQPMSASEHPNALLVSWTSPAERGSPVVSFSLYLVRGEASTELEAREGETSVLGEIVCEGYQLSCTVKALNTSIPHMLWLVAHSPGGSSQPSPAVTLLPAPLPISLTATDNGDCSFGPDDTLTLSFNAPTNRPLAESSRDGASDGATAELALEADAVATILGFSTKVGPMRGKWDAMGTTLTLWPEPVAANPEPTVDIFLAEVRVRLKPEGRVVVPPPGFSLAADRWSPPLTVPGCFVDGFEVGMLRWFAESADPESYNISIGTDHRRTGSRALRMEGGNGGQFDGLSAHLPTAVYEPRGLSCWVRSTVAANVGYLALGGPSLHEAVVFFHLRPTGQAGLLSAKGYFLGGNYSVDRWLHVAVALDWSHRTADLMLDGSLVASGVGFVSGAADARMIHIFNSDKGVVWWDDFVVY